MREIALAIGLSGSLIALAIAVSGRLHITATATGGLPRTVITDTWTGSTRICTSYETRIACAALEPQ